MSKVKYYVALSSADYGYGNNVRKCFLCIAKNKKQMKAAGMNMRLDWMRHDDYEAAKAACFGEGELKESNVSNFKH